MEKHQEREENVEEKEEIEIYHRIRDIVEEEAQRYKRLMEENKRRNDGKVKIAKEQVSTSLMRFKLRQGRLYPFNTANADTALLTLKSYVLMTFIFTFIRLATFYIL